MAAYLQGRHSLACGLWVFPQQPFLIQELAVPPIAGRLEEPIVEYILQALVQGTQDSLLGHPHSGIWVKSNALLWGRTETWVRDVKGHQSHQPGHRIKGVLLLLFLSSLPQSKVYLCLEDREAGESKINQPGWESMECLPSKHGS